MFESYGDTVCDQMLLILGVDIFSGAIGRSKGSQIALRRSAQGLDHPDLSTSEELNAKRQKEQNLTSVRLVWRLCHPLALQ